MTELYYTSQTFFRDYFFEILYCCSNRTAMKKSNFKFKIEKSHCMERISAAYVFLILTLVIKKNEFKSQRVFETKKIGNSSEFFPHKLVYLDHPNPENFQILNIFRNERKYMCSKWLVKFFYVQGVNCL